MTKSWFKESKVNVKIWVLEGMFVTEPSFTVCSNGQLKTRSYN